MNIDNSILNLNFKEKKQAPVKGSKRIYCADQFIVDLHRQEEKRIEGDFFAKKIGSPTAFYGGSAIFLSGELALLLMSKLRAKKGFATEELKKIYNKKIKLALMGLMAGTIAFMAIVQSWQNKMIDKKTPMTKKLLDEYGNDTSAKLADDNLRSILLGAQYSPINGSIEINKNYINDPIGKLMLKKYIKHELQHARQFEMIAGLENGIEKINYATFKMLADFMKKNPVALMQVQNVIEDVNNDKTGRYDNVKIPMSGAEVNFKDYVKTLEILVNNDDVKPEDLPILIDVDHYQKALEKRGPLSEEEKIKAEKYYKAMIDYPIMTGFNLMNPFSGYWKNLLEKEARKASRSKTGRINE